MAAGLMVGLVYSLVSPRRYAATAGITVAAPPASLVTTGVEFSHLGSSAYEDAQIAILESPGVANTAASAVDSSTGASLTGAQLLKALTVKPPTSGLGASSPATSLAALTEVTVSLSSPRVAAAAADAVVSAYIAQLSTEFKNQANQTIGYLDNAISKVSSELGTSSPSSSSPSSTTTTTTPGATTTTTPGATTTTTKPPKKSKSKSTTTTTTSTTTSTTTAAAAPDRWPGSEPGAATETAAYRADGAPTTADPEGDPPADPSSSSATSKAAASRSELEATLSSLNRALAELQINESIDLAYVPTTVSATVPSAPANVRYLRNTVVGIVVGLILGAVAAFALASRRRRFEHPLQPRQLYEAPLLTTVPAFERSGWALVDLPILTAPMEEAAEAFRALATALRARRGAGRCLVVAITSGQLGSGTTATVANLGLALAEMGERTVVIDADALGRGLTMALLEDFHAQGLPDLPAGFSDLLVGREFPSSFVPSIPDSRLMVIPSGSDRDLAVNRWRPGTLQSMFDRLAEHYEMVLIDTPPMATSSYGMDLVATAGNVVLVVPHHDRVEVHEDLALRLPLTAADVVGYVYNGAPSNLRFVPYYPVISQSRSAAALAGSYSHSPATSQMERVDSTS